LKGITDITDTTLIIKEHTLMLIDGVYNVHRYLVLGQVKRQPMLGSDMSMPHHLTTSLRLLVWN